MPKKPHATKKPTSPCPEAAVKKAAAVRKSRHVALTPTTAEIVPGEDTIKGLLDKLQQQDPRISADEVSFGLSFLKYFGHLNGKKLADLTYRQFLDGVRSFQDFTGIEPTGTFDMRTTNVMMAPRCGMPDVDPVRLQLELTDNQATPQVTMGWKKRHLTYFIEAYIAGIPNDVQQNIVQAAFKGWTDVCGLTVDVATDKASADIVISTGSGPRNQFDGPGGILGWGYMPTGSDQQLLLMLDQDENWAAVATGKPREILMLNVLRHELGHTAIGLLHSTIPTSLMAPYYSANVAAPISPDDIERAQALYGPPVVVAPPAPAPPTTIPAPVPPPGTTPAPVPTPVPPVDLQINISGAIADISIPGYRISKNP